MQLHVTDVSVCFSREQEAEQNEKICKQRLTHFGHIMRANGLDVGVKRKRRPPMSWLEEVKEVTRRSLDESDGH
ncbi:hypothetical protein LAZ67_1005729 [Cordylochernes scorpioides]|uniref:Uncharacterized protein n=1 Tax=Cordylochernes scorpioides TaxID=51811 RepID=A0ABY6K194_9ARAC|nr:hypothetical protein LAZ67_1005729 [Cordylochernes scorpioides]